MCLPPKWAYRCAQHAHKPWTSGIQSVGQQFSTTHTHPFNGPLSRTTRISQYQKGKTNPDLTEAIDSEWQWNPLGHTQVCTSLQTDKHTHTHTHTFNGPFSRTTRVGRYQKGKINLDSLKQETVSSSGISCALSKSASRSREITTPAPHHSVFYRPDALPAAQPTASKH